MRTVIHVGLQKTASTMLQRNLYRNRETLRQSGFGYVRLRPLEETDEVGHLPAITSSIRAIAIPKREAPSSVDVKTEVDWLKRSGNPAAIISDENILGPINHESGKPAYSNAAEIVDWLVDTLAPDSYRVILYVRSQDAYLESTYLHRVHVGRSLTFDEYMGRCDIASFDWDALATRIASAVGRGNLHVIPYETISNGELPFVNRFLELAETGVQLTQDDLAARTSNRSYSGLALELALRSNDLLKGQDLRRFRDFLQTNFSNATHPRPVLLGDEARADLLLKFSDSNKALLRKFASPQDQADGFG